MNHTISRETYNRALQFITTNKAHSTFMASAFILRNVYNIKGQLISPLTEWQIVRILDICDKPDAASWSEADILWEACPFKGSLLGQTEEVQYFWDCLRGFNYQICDEAWDNQGLLEY